MKGTSTAGVLCPHLWLEPLLVRLVAANKHHCSGCAIVMVPLVPIDCTTWMLWAFKSLRIPPLLEFSAISRLTSFSTKFESFFGISNAFLVKKKGRLLGLEQS